MADAKISALTELAATPDGADELAIVDGGVTTKRISVTNLLASKMANPMTTGADLIYGGASGVATRLANGTDGQVLTSTGTTTAPAWETVASSTPDAVKLTTFVYYTIMGTPSGTSTDPANVFDNNTGTRAGVDALNETALVTWDYPMSITQYRLYQDNATNADGVNTITYRDTDGNWQSWDTFATEGGAAHWIGWTSATEVLATGIKLEVTTLDSGGWHYWAELEIKF